MEFLRDVDGLNCSGREMLNGIWRIVEIGIAKETSMGFPIKPRFRKVDKIHYRVIFE